MSANANRDDVVSSARVALLSRRLILYIISKLRCPEDGQDADPKSAAGFWKNFYSWKHYFASGLGDEAGNFTWLSQLREYQRDSLPILRQFYDGTDTVRDALQKCVEKDQNMSAEIALQQPHMAKVANLPDLIAQREMKEMTPPEAVTQVVPVEEKKADDTIEAPADGQQSESEAKGAEKPPEEEAVLVEAEPVPEKVFDVREKFPHLVLAEFQVDLLKQVSPETLQQMIDHAETRAGLILDSVFAVACVAFLLLQLHKQGRKSFVDLKVLGKKAEKYEELLREFAVEWPKPGKVMYMMDAKNFGACKAESVAMPLSMLRQILDFVFHAEKGVFRPCDMFMFFPGNSTKSFQILKKELIARLKPFPHVCHRRGVGYIRMLYTNREFSMAEHPLGKTRVRGFLPDPLETVLMAFGKGGKVATRQRRFLDLPGDSRATGIAGLRRKTAEEMAWRMHPKHFDSIFSGFVTVEDEQEADAQDGDTTKLGAETDVPETEAEPMEALPQLVLENPEVCGREWINLYAVKESAADEVTTIVDFSPGTGVMALAAARAMVQYTGL
ncbi:unnamed protein product [Symbiodinium sp. CCMP2592]|nr:unnamed protein product [Symbiodinium sp. CCMP2592]CAE7718449.1 unnamed protein product [Symbiodinium sp. CCMP2592]